MSEYTIKARAYRETGYGTPVDGEAEQSLTHTVGRYGSEREAMRALDRLTDPTYNGWPNRETWLTHLWLSNDEPSYRAAVYVATTAGDEAEDAMRELVEDMADGSGVRSLYDEPPASLATDLLTHALAKVDYRAIVEAFRED